MLLATPHGGVLVNQVTRNVEREILNHRELLHPHIVQFKEVLASARYSPYYTVVPWPEECGVSIRHMTVFTMMGLHAGILDITVSGHCPGICGWRDLV